MEKSARIWDIGPIPVLGVLDWGPLTSLNPHCRLERESTYISRIWADRQTHIHGQTDRQTDRQTGRQTDRDRQTDGQMDECVQQTGETCE